MNLKRVDEIFDVVYGVNLELNKCILDENGINFVSRTAKNNGVSARIKSLRNKKPNPAWTLSVSGGGSVLETFFQENEYYSGRDLYYLKPKQVLTKEQMLYYCMAIRANKYRYNYGRQANRTLKEILIPHPDEIPKYVYNTDLTKFDNLGESLSKKKTKQSNINDWHYFVIDEIFNVGLGKPVHRNTIRNYSDEYEEGYLLYITRTAKNNGVELYVPRKNYTSDYIFKGNAITIGAEGFKAFYQEQDFITGNKVNILRNEYLNKYNSLFINSILNLEIEKKFGYGRGLVKSRITELKIKLPAIEISENVYIPDYKFMEKYIKSQSYSKNI